MKCQSTSACPSMSSAQLFHWGHLSLSAKVVSLDVQQHCSWLNHMALRHTPSFRSFIQSAAMSIRPAKAPGKVKDRGRRWRQGGDRKQTRKDKKKERRKVFGGWSFVWSESRLRMWKIFKRKLVSTNVKNYCLHHSSFELIKAFTLLMLMQT